MSRPRLLRLLSYAFTGGVLIYAIQVTEWDQVGRRLMGGEATWMALAFGFFGLNYGLRTWRFRILMNAGAVPFTELYAVTGLYGMFNYLMPARSGELSFPYLARVHLDTSIAGGTATLVVARYFDFATVALFFPAVLLPFADMLPEGAVAASMGLCIALYMAGFAASRWLGRLPDAHRLDSNDSEVRGGSLRRFWHRLLAELQMIGARGRYGVLWAMTTLIWLCVYANFYCITAGLGVQVSFWQVVVISMFMIPLSLLPVQGVANVGTHEIAWVAAFSLFGVPQQAALNTAIGSHAVLLFFVLVMGGASAAVLWFVQKRRL